MKNGILLACLLVFALSSAGSALTYIDTPEGRRPIEAGEWFVSGTIDTAGVEWEGMDEEWSTRANVGIQYYLTPTISVQGLTHWGYADGKTVTQPAYALNLGSDLTENLEVELGYYWSGTDRMEQNQIRVGVWYQHLNH